MMNPKITIRAAAALSNPEALRAARRQIDGAAVRALLAGVRASLPRLRSYQRTNAARQRGRGSQAGRRLGDAAVRAQVGRLTVRLAMRQLRAELRRRGIL